jgi:hypothetical protein
LGKAASDFLKSALLKEIKPEIIFLPYPHPAAITQNSKRETRL